VAWQLLDSVEEEGARRVEVETMTNSVGMVATIVAKHSGGMAGPGRQRGGKRKERRAWYIKGDLYSCVVDPSGIKGGAAVLLLASFQKFFFFYIFLL
jgi:hypothetical protein